MKLSDVHSVYMLGIGGIGMSAIARYFHRQGIRVSGYDKTPSPLTRYLEAEGIPVYFEEDPERADLSADLLVYTPAIPQNHKEFLKAKADHKTWYKRAEVLKSVTDQHSTLAVAGTHGKTTTTAILSHLLYHSGVKMAGFVGGVLSNYDSNLVCSSEVDYVVAEADEFDRSFHSLFPRVAAITSLDPDHLDIYGSHDTMKADFQQFADQVTDLLIVHESIADQIDHSNKRTYGIGEGCDYRLSEMKVENGLFKFSVHTQTTSQGHTERSRSETDSGTLNIQTTVPGKHNAENATAAIAIALELGLSNQQVESAMASFKGVKRRFEHVVRTEDTVFIDDYAHHPKEIDAAIEATRTLYPTKKLTVLFQPHLFTRTRDFEDEFAHSLSKADELLLLDIYPAREEPIPGVSSANLLNKVTLKTKELVSKAQVVNAVLSLTPESVLLLGAGDIDRLVQPIATALKSAHHVE